MASGAVWGIDVGQCALKALRCRIQENSDKILAEAFDYIEYPKILTQPGANPAELIESALKQFLSRNTVAGDRIAISVGGQAGLSRFIRLPPVEARKIPDIVRYEARQQIPFDLNDVIWDYQRMGGGSEEEGFALDAEIGLFAMKRDAVLRALEPLQKANVEIDIVQLMPLALYNFVSFDQMPALPPLDEYDLAEPPESVVVFSLGTDVTDLVITNGYRVWQRSIPIGGSHFTKALTKELKLTFAKAEHLKRNATAAADPKAVFQAMRPVFSDLLTELQRSISYFCNLDRTARIGRVIGLGNAMKLPGLRRYLSQSLGFEIERLESFQKLTGSQVIAAPAFESNLLSFGVCYGLALQALDKANVHTNLLPREIIRERLIRSKKPWAIAAAAMLLLGCTISYSAFAFALSVVNQPGWKSAESTAAAISRKANDLKTQAQAARNEFKVTDEIGQHLIKNVEKRVNWLELLRAIGACLPRDDPSKPRPENIGDRNELHITNIDCQEAPDIGKWFTGVVKKGYYQPEEPKAAAAAGAKPGLPGAAPPPLAPPPLLLGGPKPGGFGALGAPLGAGAAPAKPGAGPGGPSGSGWWVIAVRGYHYHNIDPSSAQALSRKTLQEVVFVKETLIKNLREKKIKLPTADGTGEQEVSMEDLGIMYPVLISASRPRPEEVRDPNAETEEADDARIPKGINRNPNIKPWGTPGRSNPPKAFQDPPQTPPDSGHADDKDLIKLWRSDFLVHFCWNPDLAMQRRSAAAADNETIPALPAKP